MDKLIVAQGVANKLFASEKAIDGAIAEAAALLTGLTQAREELRISAVATEASSAKIAEALALLTQARTAMVQAHGEMDELKLRVGIRTKMIGMFDKPKAVVENTTVSRVA